MALDIENPLEQYFRTNHDRRQIWKWRHYFDIYHRHFEKFRGRSPVVLEIGVFQGGSLQMWHNYFGPGALTVGVEIDPRCKTLEQPGIRIFIGDQEDRDFLRRIVSEVGAIDVVIDDGGHSMAQQITTFEELYPHLSADGVYLVEDVHTSYWTGFGGGYRQPGTFMEFAKSLTDKLNAWHREDPTDPTKPTPMEFSVDEFTRTTKSITFYDSIVVLERQNIPAPGHEKIGYVTKDDDDWEFS